MNIDLEELKKHYIEITAGVDRIYHLANQELVTRPLGGTIYVDKTLRDIRSVAEETRKLLHSCLA